MTMTLLPFGFIRRIAVCFWCGDSRAGASNAMATLASLGTAGDHWNGEEQRFARDGMPYTFLQFIEYYGERGNARWQEAPIATAGGAPQPADAAGRGGPCTSAQVSPQAQPAPTIAGAPQPGAAAGPGVPSTPGQQPA